MQLYTIKILHSAFLSCDVLFVAHIRLELIKLRTSQLTRRKTPDAI